MIKVLYRIRVYEVEGDREELLERQDSGSKEIIKIVFPLTGKILFVNLSEIILL